MGSADFPGLAAPPTIALLRPNAPTAVYLHYTSIHTDIKLFTNHVIDKKVKKPQENI